MKEEYYNITLENIEQEHLCCAISDSKHQAGVSAKKNWLKQQIPKGHVFRKLNQNGKVFIEYGPLENEFVPVIGENYIYLYCFWVSGSFKGQGHGKRLLEYAILDAKQQGRSGICVVVGKKKIPYLSDRNYLEQFGFRVVDSIEPNYNLLALSFDQRDTPTFTLKAKNNQVGEKGLVIYYNQECPYTEHCLVEIKEVCKEKKIPLTLHLVDTVEQAKDLPGFMNNFCVFYQGKFVTHELINRNRLIKFLLLS